jgi:hypothetical protein
MLAAVVLVAIWHDGKDGDIWFRLWDLLLLVLILVAGVLGTLAVVTGIWRRVRRWRADGFYDPDEYGRGGVTLLERLLGTNEEVRAGAFATRPPGWEHPCGLPRPGPRGTRWACRTCGCPWVVREYSELSAVPAAPWKNPRSIDHSLRSRRTKTRVWQFDSGAASRRQSR